MRAWIVAVAVSLAVLGIGSPRVAGRAGHLLLITVGLIVAAVAVQPVFTAIEQRRAEAFVPTPPRAHRATMPNQMAEIVDAFTSRARSGDVELVPPQLIRRITVAATGRILDHHHLHLGNSDDHPAIRELVSPTLWTLIRPVEPGTATPPTLRFDELDRLLDELERM
ncbi:MAG: hypothetical protein ACRDZZ_12905 [Ilumatobacteraceae bacterium]